VREADLAVVDAAAETDATPMVTLTRFAAWARRPTSPQLSPGDDIDAARGPAISRQ
jgi:hypothetical protein